MVSTGKRDMISNNTKTGEGSCFTGEPQSSKP